MEVGPQYKIGFIIQARMKSERLYGKVLKPIPFPDGDPLLSLILKKLNTIKGKVVVATSIESENDEIEAFCNQNNVECFRGSENNVLSRFIEIQKKFKFDYILRFTADNPIIDIDILNKFIKYHVSKNIQYSSTQGLPLGMNFEMFNGSTILQSEKYAESYSDKEHVTLAIKREPSFKKYCFKINTGLNHLRLTVDTPRDFLTLSTILSFGITNNLRGLRLINKLHLESPWIFDANKKDIQKNSSLEYKDELESAIELLKSLDYNRVVKKLKT